MSYQCRATSSIVLQSCWRGALVRFALARAQVALENARATQLQQWATYHRERKKLRRATRGAMQIQRWIRRRLDIIEFFTTVCFEMEALRQPAKIIQRTVRRYFVRQVLRRRQLEKQATALMYPDAPLCCVCLSQMNPLRTETNPGPPRHLDTPSVGIHIPSEEHSEKADSTASHTLVENHSEKPSSEKLSSGTPRNSEKLSSGTPHTLEKHSENPDLVKPPPEPHSKEQELPGPNLTLPPNQNINPSNPNPSPLRSELPPRIFTLALIRCEQCQDPFCISCFAKYHSSGRRARHATQMIDFQIFDRKAETRLCTRCCVQKVQRMCTTCDESYCRLCFEQVHPHSDSNMRTHLWQNPERLNQKEEEEEENAAPPKPKPIVKAKNTRIWGKLPLRRPAEEISEILPPVPPRWGILPEKVLENFNWQSINRLKAANEHEILELLQRERERDAREALLNEHRAWLREAFDEFDSDGSGTLDAAELRPFLQQECCEPISNTECQEALASIDRNGNGVIEFDEFLEWFCTVWHDSEQQHSLPNALKRHRLQFLKSWRKFTSTGEKSPKEEHSQEPKELQKEPLVVPGYDSVLQLEPSEGDSGAKSWQSKESVFRSFLEHEYDLEWLKEDWSEIPSERLYVIFYSLFVPKWNLGELEHRYYLDNVDFLDPETGISWTSCWQETWGKYGFVKASETRIERVDPRVRSSCQERLTKAWSKVGWTQARVLSHKDVRHLLVNVMCLVYTKEGLEQVIEEIDPQDLEEIDFDSLLLWYMIDVSQQYPLTSKIKVLQNRLKAQREAKLICKFTCCSMSYREV